MIKCRKIFCLLVLALGVLQAGTKVCAVEPQELLRHLEEAAQGGPVYEVIPDGTGDFSSIQEAVEQVESGATLLIHQGTYEENVEIVDKTVNLIGADRDACILIANTGNYHHVPLTIGAGVVYNMTICGSNPTKRNMIPLVDADFDLEDPVSVYNYQNMFPGYAVHIEQDYSCGRELLVEGCRIISDSNYCVGIGCRGGSLVTFADCQFYSSGGGCVYIHNTPSDSGNHEDAYFTMRDCELKNYVNPYMMSVCSTGDQHLVYLTFQNVKVSTVVYTSKHSYTNGNMNTWYNVDQLSSPAVQRQLEAGGYYTTLGRELVHYCSEGEHAYLAVGRDRESLLGRWPDFPEGIHYIRKAASADRRTDQASTAQEELNQRQVIEIINRDPEADRNGWCGLHNIFLTRDSYGNTLTEMNYPRLTMDVGVQ